MARSDGRHAVRVASIALIALFLLGGCTPSCERTCRKVLKCDGLESDRVSVLECEASCQREGTTYQGWADEKELDDAFDAHRRCLVRSTCEEIADGVCYDERLFQVGVPTGDTGTSASR